MRKKLDKKISPREVVLEFWKGMSGYKLMFSLSILLFIINEVIKVIVPLYFKKFFDLITTTKDLDSTFSSAFRILVFILVMRFCSWLFWRTGIYFYNIMQSRVISRLKQNSFEYLMRHSYAFFANNFTGGLVQKINRFSRAFESITDSLSFNLIPLTISVFGSIYFTYKIEPVFSLFIGSWVTIFTIFSFYYFRWKQKFDIEATEADSRTSGYLSDAITNNNAVSFFNGYTFEQDAFTEVSNDHAKKMRWSWQLSEVSDAVQSFLILCIEFLIFYYGLKYWRAGEISIGTLVLAQTYVVGLSGQLWGLGRIIRNVYQSFADSKEMVDIMNLPYEIKDLPDAKDLVVNGGKIEYKEVSFSFNTDRDVLSDINIAINPGEKIAVVGPSGAGKTTFVRLLMRLYDNTKGEILIDGQNIKEVTQDSLRECISLVPQDPILFHRTLMENIRYGRRGATDEEVIEASRLAHCDDFIDKLPLKYETFVGERGIKLSGGERQRIAIARAILKRSPILVLDEATSSLDSHSENLIQDALSNLMKTCTTIVIAHRLSTIKMMDRILVFSDGKIIENGSHEQLLNKENGMYKKLWNLQVGGFIQED